MAVVESPSMVLYFLTKISLDYWTLRAYYVWPTKDRTLMAHNFSLHYVNVLI
jgi:hypothetical protein